MRKGIMKNLNRSRTLAPRADPGNGANGAGTASPPNCCPGKAGDEAVPAPLIHTGALARWKDAHSTWELFQQFVASGRNPLKRLIRPRTSRHRAKAPVLMTTCWNACGICGLGAALLLAGVGSALADVHYVDVNGTNATPPYTNWTTAATNIQEAVGAAVAGDEIVVTNGTYGPVGVGKPLSVRSVNGAQFTTIDGSTYNRCVYLTNGASLSGFTLTNGQSDYGGGVYGGTLINCVLARNNAIGGGGAAYSTLVNCTLSGNQAYASVQAQGGGAYFCTLNNCTLSGNSAGGVIDTLYTYAWGGGAYECKLNNCILWGNSASGTYTFGGGAA